MDLREYLTIIFSQWAYKVDSIAEYINFMFHVSEREVTIYLPKTNFIVRGNLVRKNNFVPAARNHFEVGRKDVIVFRHDKFLPAIYELDIVRRGGLDSWLYIDKVEWERIKDMLVNPNHLNLRRAPTKRNSKYNRRLLQKAGLSFGAAEYFANRKAREKAFL